MSDLYNTIKTKRLLMNISQKEMSEKLNMQQAGYSLLEKGKNKITVDRLEEIAKILGVPMTYFFDKHVQELIDTLLERVDDMNKLHAQNSYVVELPDYKQDMIESNQKLLRSMEEKVDAIKSLSDYRLREIYASKAILKAIVECIKAKKPVKTDLTKRAEQFVNSGEKSIFG